MENYELIVGLEVHAELSTHTKAFCGCKNEFGGIPNTNVCPICMALPGSMPMLNETVADYAVIMGKALNCKIQQKSYMDRKTYFYADLPKAYQISQVAFPICKDGRLSILVNGSIKEIGITQIHIEEDVAKLIHDGEITLADYNRAGVPLIEIVTAPDFRNVDEVRVFLNTIKAILEFLDISDAKMQEGSIRCDINVSMRPIGSDVFGTRVEMKNVNTFSGAVRAIEYEMNRQLECIKNNEPILGETRKWDDSIGKNIPIREKTGGTVYLPDPDFGVLVYDESSCQIEHEKLPNIRMIKYVNKYGLSEDDASLLALSKAKADFFEACLLLAHADDPKFIKLVANWIIGYISMILNEGKHTLDDISPKNIMELCMAIDKGTISNTAGKAVVDELFTGTASSVGTIIADKGLGQISDTSALTVIIDEVLSNNAKSIEDYKNGKSNALGYLVGQCMRASKGKGNPQMFNDMIKERIDT